MCCHNKNLTHVRQTYVAFLIIKSVQHSHHLNFLHHLCSWKYNKQTPTQQKDHQYTVNLLVFFWRCLKQQHVVILDQNFTSLCCVRNPKSAGAPSSTCSLTVLQSPSPCPEPELNNLSYQKQTCRLKKINLFLSHDFSVLHKPWLVWTMTLRK